MASESAFRNSGTKHWQVKQCDDHQTFVGDLLVLKPGERTTVFVIFCALAVACAGIEFYLLYSMIDKGFTGGKAVAGIVNLSIMGVAGKIFLKIASKNFLDPDSIISFSKLHSLVSARVRILPQDGQGTVDEYAIRQRLVTEVLRFAVESLKDWLPGTHFELCIFVDGEQPLLFAYFDSNQESTARSMRYREENPLWYLEKDYEVTKLLRQPSSHPKIIQNTEDKRKQYMFASIHQRKQVKSTMLWCFDLDFPCAIVVTSNVKNAFRESDPEVVSFIKFIGSMARFDLFDKGFIRRIHELKPNLFPPQTV